MTVLELHYEHLLNSLSSVATEEIPKANHISRLTGVDGQQSFVFSVSRKMFELRYR